MSEFNSEALHTDTLFSSAPIMLTTTRMLCMHRTGDTGTGRDTATVTIADMMIGDTVDTRTGEIMTMGITTGDGDD